MAILADKRIEGAGFRNAAKYVRVVYDFAKDTGAVADYDVIVADGACLVELVNIDVKTAITATATSVLDLGKNVGGVEFKSNLDVAAGIAIDTQIGADTAGLFVELADGEKIVMGIETAAITAGKFEMMFRVYSR